MNIRNKRCLDDTCLFHKFIFVSLISVDEVFVHEPFFCQSPFSFVIEVPPRTSFIVLYADFKINLEEEREVYYFAK